jgi:two-component system, sensor histidine kinase and response regulator
MERTAKVLIVDDEYNNLKVLFSILDKKRYGVSAATNASEAFKIIELEMPDIILLDVMMPEINGFEICKKLKSDTRYGNIPVIFISALHDSEDIVKGFKYGAADFVSKPFNAEIVLARIDTHLKIKFQAEHLVLLNKSLENKVKERTKELWAANEKLLNLDEAKSEFLQIISHEIRTPLNGIMVSMQLITTKCNDANLYALIGVLNESVNRLEKFSIDALLITQLKLNRYRTKSRTFGICSLVNQLEKELCESMGKKNLALNVSCTIADDLIDSDYELLKKALLEILDNAIHYSPPGSTIEMTVKREGGTHYIGIKDHGVGFSKKSLKNIFGLFSPGEKHVNINQGIELALCKLIMHTLGGDIEAGNHESGGAMVKIHFKSVINNEAGK